MPVTMRGACLLAVLAACAGARPPSPPAPPRPDGEAVFLDGARDGDPLQGEPCSDGRCAPGLTCLSWYGIAGPRGPTFTSCEIPCAESRQACPEGQACVTVADGPGRVCRPR